MILLFIALSGVSIFIIATVTIGAVTNSQIQKPRRALYDLNQAVEFVADRLSNETTAEISYDDVRSVLNLHVEFLMFKGLASEKTDDVVEADLVVVSEEDALGWILTKADEGELPVTDEQIAEILVAQNEYYEQIGAFGPPLVE